MNKKIVLILKIIAAIIMFQTLFYKFPGAQESVDLFTKLVGENEAYMRIGTGILELLATIFLFIPRTTWFGAILTIGLMCGAILSHLMILGIEHNNDGGLLFISAMITLISGIVVLLSEKENIPFFKKS